ncbi:MAG: class I SAM-dependent methyltransferase [Methylococcaceae bacterium]|nr:class I SAM-dependent methyltransferase [Methylococcaceae bacterium]MDP3904959.1 class I SAM-dependent methyltransferase [Methylococcaceae bacterium]
MDQTKIWDYFQNQDETSDAFAGARSRYEFLAQQVKKGQRVLNIGVGRGGLEAILLTNGAVVSCLDPSEKSIENLRHQFALGDRAQVGFSQAMPFPDSEFDVVIMSEVLEHLSDEVLHSTLSEVSRVLRDGGKFIGTVPADENLVENLVMCPHCGKPFHRWGHIQSFDAKRLTDLLQTPFKNITVSRHFFGDTDSLNWKGRIASIIKIIMVRSGVKGSGETYFFSASKR